MNDGSNRDTSPTTERVHAELLRAAGPESRARLASRLTQVARQRAFAAIARAHPALTERDQRLLFVEVHYGREMAERVRADLDRRSQPDQTETPAA